MREVKFRAWDKRNGAMVSWKTILKECDRLSILTYSDYEIMQFTGLKDKNGKEIWEGDIVKYGYADFEEDKTIHQIKYMGEDNYPAFDLFPYLDCDSNGLSHTMAEGELEIIGNIYENPELIK